MPITLTITLLRAEVAKISTEQVYRKVIDQTFQRLASDVVGSAPTLRPDLAEAIKRKWLSAMLRSLNDLGTASHSTAPAHAAADLSANSLLAGKVDVDVTSAKECEDWDSDDFDDTEIVHATASSLAQHKQTVAHTKTDLQLQKAHDMTTTPATASVLSAPRVLVNEETLSEAEAEEANQHNPVPETSDCPVRVYAQLEIRDLTGKKQKVPPAWKLTLKNGIVKIRGQPEILFKTAEQTLGIVDAD